MWSGAAFQSTRPLRGATAQDALEAYNRQISIHAPLAGRDHYTHTDIDFLSKISIHAPLAGRDHYYNMLRSELSYFNPRAPCGARLFRASPARAARVFQSTRPLRGATVSYGG